MWESIKLKKKDVIELSSDAKTLTPEQVMFTLAEKPSPKTWWFKKIHPSKGGRTDRLSTLNFEPAPDTRCGDVMRQSSDVILLAMMDLASLGVMMRCSLVVIWG